MYNFCSECVVWVIIKGRSSRSEALCYKNTVFYYSVFCCRQCLSVDGIRLKETAMLIRLKETTCLYLI